MTNFRVMLSIAGSLLLACGAKSAFAAEPPSDLCSLLPAVTVSKTLGTSYGSPQKSVAERPFANTATGTDCRYQSRRNSLLFRTYVDPSPSASADLFARLKNFFGRGSADVTGIADEAYFDARHGLHVRKGKVRYFISGAGSDQQLKELATGIAQQL